MTRESFPPVAELLPHSGPMRLLEGVVEHTPEETRCSVDVERSALFRDSDGRIPVWVGIEYMAQCIAAHGGLAARARGERPRPGLFLGSRLLTFRADAFEAGARLEVTARHRFGGSGPLAFDCAVRDPAGGPPLVEGRLHVLPLDGPEVLASQGSGR